MFYVVTYENKADEVEVEIDYAGLLFRAYINKFTRRIHHPNVKLPPKMRYALFDLMKGVLSSAKRDNGENDR